MTSRTRRVAAVDCGTNSIRLLIADIEGDTHALTDVVRRMDIVRLGHGVDKTGVIAPEAMARTLAKAREYAQQCRDHGVTAIRFVATSASRDASNADEFVAGVRAAFGDNLGHGGFLKGEIGMPQPYGAAIMAASRTC